MWAEWVGRTDEPDPGDLIDPHVHHPFRRVVAEFDLPPPQVGWSLEHRCGRAGQARRGEAVAEDEDQRPGRRQVRDQTFYLAGGLAAICGLAHLVLLPRGGAVSGWQHGTAQGRYPATQPVSLVGVTP